MAATVKCRPQERTLGMVMKEVDEDLAIFLGMRRSAKEREDDLHSSPIFDYINDSLFEETPADDRTAKEFSTSSANDTSEYNEWLLSLSSYPSINDEEENDAVDWTGKRSDLAELDLMATNDSNSPKDEETSQNELLVHSSSTTSGKSISSSNSKNSSSAGNSTTSSSSGRSRRKPNAATPKAGRSLPLSLSKSSRPSTPTSRSSLPSAPPLVTTTSSRSSVTSSRSGSRSATPTSRTTCVVKPGLASWKKSAASATLVSPSAPPPSTAGGGKSRHSRSCSPSRAQTQNNTHAHSQNKRASLSRSRGSWYTKDEDAVMMNPVQVGTKMVERVVNMRKLAPPKHADDPSKKSSLSHRGSSFGTSFSKMSLDMAIRHMVIK
ncbi:unnamed protein product [Cuscuta epithymum]|uniref:Uncharacterized protein n=1 Tax=Cuscuta epithymum TaxID=186058 RepID=A0AAV0D335_9ASTE|nr:unnamed protein product [Cuscuta epithymum]